VLERLDRAHARVADAVGSLSPDEASDERFVQEITVQTFGHYPQHLGELRAVLSA
jgi:hypothetical protein